MLKDSLFKKKPYAALPEARPRQGCGSSSGICSAAVPGADTHPSVSGNQQVFRFASAPNRPLPCPGAALPSFPAVPSPAPRLAFALPPPCLSYAFPGKAAKKENILLCWPLTCEELLVKPTAHQMAGISCARSVDGWRCLSPLSAPIFAMCVVVEGFAPILLIKEKRKCVYYS